MPHRHVCFKCNEKLLKWWGLSNENSGFLCLRLPENVWNLSGQGNFVGEPHPRRCADAVEDRRITYCSSHSLFLAGSGSHLTFNECQKSQKWTTLINTLQLTCVVFAPGVASYYIYKLLLHSRKSEHNNETIKHTGEILQFYPQHQGNGRDRKDRWLTFSLQFCMLLKIC